ncbi:MAG TPA: Pvc16 family protein [Solirubrobacteraceae bacterium]|nr:Pvc16 family protein [Solirubrobacteraceae bacterium]
MASVPSVDIPPTMLLADLDEVLRALLERELRGNGFHGVTITFEAPSRERSAEWPSPALNLFLYDVREADEALDRSWHQTEVDGRGMLVRPPLRLACTYAVTAWTRAVVDEHRLLSQVVAILHAYPRLPTPAAGVLEGDPPVPMTTRLGHTREQGRAEFWNAVGGQYKVSVEYTVVVAVDPGVSVRRGPRVGAGGVGVGAATAYAGSGTLLEASGLPAPDAEVALPALGLTTRTADDGSFVLRPLPAGTHRLVGRTRDRREVEGRLAVPGEGLTLTFPAP